ncbi:MAG: D-alanine--D-alanine ligase [Legionellaceae bacterium]|nr:D-alanine--D-alanine ligase [Legionellaceae bacterium]
MARLKLMLLYGGPSGEHEVSLQSAASVLAALDAEQYDVLAIGMDKQGCFYINQTDALRSKYRDALPVALPDAERLPSLIVNGKLAVDADLVFPVMHGQLCEDGALQGLLNLTGVAYVGCDVLSAAVSMDKDIARQLVGHIEGIHAVPYHRLPYTESAELDSRRCEAAVAELGWPVFVKPSSLGSSVGIHRADSMEQLMAAVQDARRYDTTVLIEAFIAGREIEVGVLEHDACEGLPDVTLPGEIKIEHADGFYSYAAKYLESNDSKLCIPAELDADAIKHVQMAAAEIFMRLRCRGLARVDFFVQAGTNKIYFNEINTMPGFTSISMFPKLWEASGLNYSALLDRVIALAQMRQRSREKLITDYSSAREHALA